MKIKENQVYIWEQGNCILGFCKVSINGIEEEFGGGYEITDREGKETKSGLAKNRAIRQVKIQFANVMDAVRFYGKKILDKEGNVDPKKFLEYETAKKRTEAKNILKKVFKKEEKPTQLKDLKVSMITEEESFKLGIANN